MKMPGSPFIIEHLQNEMREALAHPQNRKRCRKDREKLEKALKQCFGREELSLILHHFSFYIGTAAAEMVSGLFDSERDIADRLSYFLEGWWLFYSESGRTNWHPNFHNHALMFLAFRQFERAAWIFPRLEPSHPSKLFWEPNLEHPLEFYCRCLWALHNGKTPREEDVQRCGVYADILRHWNNHEALSRALSAACDYHLSRAVEPEGYEVHEFSHVPFTLLPVEILALRAVRENAGLPVPEADHPLLNTPLIKLLPRDLPEARDELLEKIKAAVARVNGNGRGAEAAVGEAAPAGAEAPPAFSTEEEGVKTGFLRRVYSLTAILRFTPGETLETHWPRLMAALDAWRGRWGKNAAILTIAFQSDPALHAGIYGEFSARVRAAPALEAWIETLRDYTLSFQTPDGADCRDLVWEKRSEGGHLFSEMNFTSVEGEKRGE